MQMGLWVERYESSDECSQQVLCKQPCKSIEPDCQESQGTMKFTIGTSGSKAVAVDSLVLADTRGLICASSGLGKSWLLRLISETVASSVQTIIIDPEGEFSSLREKLDLLIVSENGDLRADIRSAGLLARKLAETGVSAVIDIYDLPGKEDPWVKRRMFVAEFIE